MHSRIGKRWHRSTPLSRRRCLAPSLLQNKPSCKLIHQCCGAGSNVVRVAAQRTVCMRAAQHSTCFMPIAKVQGTPLAAWKGYVVRRYFFQSLFGLRDRDRSQRVKVFSDRASRSFQVSHCFSGPNSSPRLSLRRRSSLLSSSRRIRSSLCTRVLESARIGASRPRHSRASALILR